MKNNLRPLALAGISFLAACMAAFAAETTGLQAKTAVRNWVRRNTHPMATAIADGEGVARTFRNDAGKVLFHAVDLEGGGFVIASGDTKESPIVAFSDSGTFDATMKNPLYALIVQHMGAAADAIAAEETNAVKRSRGFLSASPSSAGSASGAESEWAELLDDSTTVTVGTRSSRVLLGSTADTSDSMITDMRVPPLCPTQWSQQNWNASGYAFNYYTPNYYPCGCTATAMAQIMYRWQEPKGYVSPRSYQCVVNGEAETLTTFGGYYSWNAMPVSMVEQYSATLAERQAVGYLLHDVGVSIRSSYSSGGTGSFGFFIPGALKEHFGYVEGKVYPMRVTYGSDASEWAALENGVYASLDAGMPVALSIHKPLSGSKSGHCVVLDGYGYIGSTRWTHLNSGWAGKSDAWYLFFGETLTSMDYTYLQEFAYNMHPSIVGDVVSGRVTDHTGRPVAGATVTCETPDGGEMDASTDEYGIYFFRVTESGDYGLSAVKGGLSSPTRDAYVTIGRTCSFSTTFSGSGWGVYNVSGASVGNKWGQDLQLSAPTITSLEITGPSSVNCGKSAQYVATARYSDGSTKVVTTASSWSLDSGESYGSIGLHTGLLGTYETYDTGRKVTISAHYVGDGPCEFAVATKEVSIVPMKKERVFTSLSLTGPSSVEGGSTASYTAVAGFDDGSTSNVTMIASWSLPAGSSYGSISSAGVLSANETTESGRSVTVRTQWTYNGKTLSAQKQVDILFSTRLKRPLSLSVNGASTLVAGMTTPYTATVFYNDGTSEDVTIAKSTSWSLTQPRPWSVLTASSFRQELKAYGFSDSDSRTVTVNASYSEMCGRAGGGTEKVTVSGSRLVMITPLISIPEAVDVHKDGEIICDLKFDTGSTVAGNCWYGQSGKYHYDGDAAQSGFMSGSYGQNWLETKVSGAGTLSFWWNVSSEPVYDHLKFEIDGIQYGESISGLDRSWTNVVAELGSGEHTLRWTYVKDEMNDYGEDAGWVDKIEWTPLDPPAAPVVTATDGTSTESVVVDWTEPSSVRSVAFYEVSRSSDGGSSWAVLAASATGRRWTDDSASPGVDYTYRVRAANDAGWGDYGSDAGWRRIALSVAPDEISAPHGGGEYYVAVTSSVPWTAGAEDWISATPAAGSGTGAIRLDIGAKDDIKTRAGGVTVAAGAELAHPETAEVLVSQEGRPARCDIGFCLPRDDWRIPLQIGDSLAEEGDYAPVSVFGREEIIDLSFGWTNRGEKAVSMPGVKFTVLNPACEKVLEWREAARPEETLDPGEGAASCKWECGIVQMLDPGDYKLEAKLDPDNTLADVDTSDNLEIFRFAVADPALDKGDVFTTPTWTNIEFKAGSGFAQSPHIAVRGVPLPDGSATADVATVQFGPYTPMDGLVSRVGGKKPLDLIFLIDVTGSMGSCITGLKNNINAFVDSLTTGPDAVTDWRAKVVGFGDYYCDLGDWYNDRGFQTDTATLKNQISTLKMTWGGDGPEAMLDGLYKVVNESEFREDAARVVLAFTDIEFKNPMTAPGLIGLNIEDTVALLNEKKVVFTAVTPRLSASGTDKMVALCKAENAEHIVTSSLASFAADESKIRELATGVSSHVATEMVEPFMTASTRGRGTLTFRWRNETIADTNNVYRFTCVDELSPTNLVCEMDDGWKTETLEFKEGWHVFKWTYAKFGYEGAVSDCGILADVEWEPYGTKLELDPLYAEYPYVGSTGVTEIVSGDVFTGGVVRVRSNAIWKASTEDDWIVLEEGRDSGYGDWDGLGESLCYTVATNTNYVARTGWITVTAGGYGLASDSNVVMSVQIDQKAAPYVEDGTVRILDVGVKPRWPWNSKVDIDFRVVAPEKGIATEIAFVGRDDQGAGFEFKSEQTWRDCTPKAQNCNQVSETPVTLATLKSAGTSTAKFECPSSGVYRITWDVGADWRRNGSWMWNGQNSFHSPDFSVVLTATATNAIGVVQSASMKSKPVRVDTRGTSFQGGRLATGTELVGHDAGLVNPRPWNTTLERDGKASAAMVFDEGDRNDNMEKIDVCVVNDAVVEGGTIAEDTTWGADVVHVIRDNVFVPDGVTLTIEDGAVLKFCDMTRIFCMSNIDSIAVGWNVNVKGAYCVQLNNSTVGDDTLGDGADAIGNATFISSSSYFFDNASTESKGSELANSKGLFNVVLSAVKQGSTAIDDYETWRTRSYTRNQPYGNLPRPVVKAGEQFYGWILSNNNPGQTLKNVKDGPGSTAYINAYKGMTNNIVNSSKIVFPVKVPNDLRDSASRKLWAYSDLPENQPKSYCEKIDGGAARVVLTPASAEYNGCKHEPVVSVSVGEAVVPSDNYEIEWDGGCTNVGIYTATINFKWDYTGSPSATFEITPCEVDDAVVVLSPRSMLYSGYVQKPSVEVKLGDGTTVASHDYVVEWGEGDWTAVGEYEVRVVFKGNYTGEASANFQIEENDELKVVFLDSRAAAEARLREKSSADGRRRRILFVSGRDDDVPTRFVRHCLADVPRIRNTVIDNFVCWYDDCDSDDTEYPTYAKGLDSVALPLVGAISTNDMSKCVMRHVGYMSEDDVYNFVVAAITEPEDASSASVALAPASFTWDGSAKTPSATVTYAGKVVPPANYTLEFSSDVRRDVGTYAAWAVFRPEVPYGGSWLTGRTERATFQIVPKRYGAGDVSLSPSSAVYDGRMHKPSVVTSDAGATCTVDYGDGDYVSAGDYSVKVSFVGGGTGEAVLPFSILRADADAAVVSLEWYSAKADGTERKPAVASVVLGDHTFGEDEFDVEYGDGEDDLSAAESHVVTVSFKGNWKGSATASYRLYDDPLPEVDDPDDIDDSLDGLGLGDEDGLAKVKEWIKGKGDDSAIDAYESFRSWVAEVGVDAVKSSSRVYESFRLSSVLAAPQMLGDSDEVELKISDFAVGADESSAWNLTVRIVCGDGDDSVDFVLAQVESAKAAFAEMVRRSGTLDGLDDGVVGLEDVDATLSDDRCAITLSVEPPSGGKSGFMTIRMK